MPASQDPIKGDPYVSCYFKVSFGDHVKNLVFTEISGISKEFEIAEHKVLTPKGQEVVRKLPGRVKWGQLTLKRGITSELDVYKWRQLVEQGKVKDARVNGTIHMLDMASDSVLAEWNVTAAWPSKISGPNFKADENAVATEELSVVYEGIERTK
ncbi:MAG: phage tail protein [Anaerolineales bacterium]|nr:phage tail protein [Anaerolineales bacterium]